MKKLISALLVVCLLAACCTAFAADVAVEKEADALNVLGLFLGTDKGYQLDSNMTREQGVVMLNRLMGNEKEANSGKYSCPFGDVYDWAKGHVGYAYNKKITNGVSATSFGYGNPLTDAMFYTMLMRAVGYTEGESGDLNWDAPYELAKQVGLCASGEAKEDFTRGDMVDACWKMLNVKYKGTEVTVVSMLVKKNIVTANAVAAAEKVAAGTMTLEQAKAAISGGSSDGGSGSGSGDGGSGAGNQPIPDPTIGGHVTDPSSTLEDHETPDMDP